MRKRRRPFADTLLEGGDEDEDIGDTGMKYMVMNDDDAGGALHERTLVMATMSRRNRMRKLAMAIQRSRRLSSLSCRMRRPQPR